jgi:hypothetical protein
MGGSFVGGSDAVPVIDDTAIPKKGMHSVGVASQYASALGKIANCQREVRPSHAGVAAVSSRELGEQAGSIGSSGWASRIWHGPNEAGDCFGGDRSW